MVRRKTSSIASATTSRWPVVSVMNVSGRASTYWINSALRMNGSPPKWVS